MLRDLRETGGGGEGITALQRMENQMEMNTEHERKLALYVGLLLLLKGRVGVVEDCRGCLSIRNQGECSTRRGIYYEGTSVQANPKA